MPLSTILNYSVYAILGVFALIGLYLGYKRGVSRQTMKLCTLFLSFGVSYFVFSKIYPSLYSLVGGKTIAEIVTGYGVTLDEGVYNLADSVAGDTAAYVAAVPLALIIIPVGFLLCFGSITGLLTIPYIVICGTLGFGKKYNTIWTRIAGGALGALQGLLIAGLILTPVAGSLDVVEEAVTLAEEEHPDSANTVAIAYAYHANLDEVTANPALQQVDDAFGFIYDKFSTITVEGEEVSVREIADDMFELFVLYGDLGADFDYTQLTEENKATINEMITCFGDDHLMTAIVSGLLNSIGRASQNGALVLEYDEPMLSLTNEILGICSTSTSETIDDDLRTIAEVYFLFSDEKMLIAETKNEMFASFLSLDADGSSAFKRMVLIFEKNPRFAHMAEVCNKVAMDLVLDNSGVNHDVIETINDVKTGINDVLKINRDDYETEEEYKAEVTNGISSTLEEKGINLSEDKLDKLSDFVIDNYASQGKEEITDEDMLDFMSKYYDIYTSSGSSVPPVDGGDEPPVDE